MDDNPRIILDIPEAEDFEHGDHYLLVPWDVVNATIDLLQGCMVQWKNDIEFEPDPQVWGDLMAAAGHALGGLVAAYAADDTHAGTRRLVDQIAYALGRNDARASLDAVRDRHVGYIVDALLEVHDEAQRRRTQSKQQQAAAGDPAPAEQGPAASSERRPAWEF